MIATVMLGLAALIYKTMPFISRIATQANFQHEFAFIVDAFTFLVSAMLIFTIAFPRRTEGKPEISFRNIWGDLKEGLRFMRTNQLTRSIIGVMIIGFIGGGSIYIPVSYTHLTLP